MSISRYIRPMSFGETIGSMFRLYWKVVIPIFFMNSLIIAFTFGYSLIGGLIVGPVVMMTSNAILGRRVKVWGSIKKGLSLILLFKLALLFVAYIIFITILQMIVSTISSYEIGLGVAIFIYLFLSPVLVFVPMIMLLEKKGLRASTKRSFQIFRKNFIRICQMNIFIYAILIVLATLLSLSIMGDADLTLVAGFALLAGSVTGFSSVPLVFVYYEYRARFENYSDELLTEEMGYQQMEEMMTV